MILNAKMIVIVLIVLLLLFVFISPISGQNDSEDSYRNFADEAEQKKAQNQVMCAEARGDGFFYGNGAIAKLIEGERDE